MRARGFSLIELAVASAMAGVIAVSAIGAFAYLNRTLIRVEREATVSDNAKSVVDLLVTRMQGIGGGAIRPWMAAWVENGGSADADRDTLFTRPGAVTSDRLTYAVLEPSTPTCMITAMTATTVVSSPSAGVCCLERMFAPVAGVDPATAATQLTVYATNGELHRQLVINKPTLASCSSTILPGPLADLDNVTLASSSQLSGGTVSRARIKTLYVNARNELREFERFGAFPNKGFNVDDSTLVSTDVFDLQFQLGFDTVADGRIVDDTNATDEWLYNHPGDNEDDFTPSSLRMIGVGVVVGTRTTDGQQIHTARAAGGQIIGSRFVFMRGAQGRAALRNLFVFN